MEQVLWWFVPFVWWFAPYRATKELWRGSSAPVGDRFWKDEPVPDWFVWWWTAHIACMAVSGNTMETLLGWMAVPISALAYTVSDAFYLRMVWGVTRAQEARVAELEAANAAAPPPG